MSEVAETEIKTETSEEKSSRKIPFSEPFRKFICTGWADYDSSGYQELAAAKWTPARRDAVRKAFPGKTLIIPAGPLKVRNNDCDYRYRPHTTFAHLSGLGTDREPDAVLVISPDDERLYFKPRAPRTDPEFYSDSRYGEMWVGQRESLEEMATMIGFTTRPIAELAKDLAKDPKNLVVLREADPEITSLVDELRSQSGNDSYDNQANQNQTETVAASVNNSDTPADSSATPDTPTIPDAGATERPDLKLDNDLDTFADELRLIKDEFEITQMREACEKTAYAFSQVVADFPNAIANGRGERWVEGVFGLHARHLGNAVGYDTIAAGADHANTLHWIRNDGDLKPGDLILLDAGIEVDTLYTADVTRTLPLSGKFTPAQRQVYQAVYEAQEAGIAACRPGAVFADVHNAAIAVIAKYLEEWGILPVSAAESLDPERGGHHRRWMVHGTSHHLGMDVHDCAQARNEQYRFGELKPGMVITVEPGIYFKATDLLVPPEFRGIGVRIEDDILITADGCENLSAGLPRAASEVEEWMAKIL